MGKDVLYEFHGFKFSWDSEKAQKNIRDHEGISFEIAAQAVVNDVQVVEELDEEGEQRFGIISFALSEHLATPPFCRSCRFRRGRLAHSFSSKGNP